jgi:hypothetical protein
VWGILIGMAMAMRMPVTGFHFMSCTRMRSGMQAAFNGGSDGLVDPTAIEELARKEKEGYGHRDEWE